MFETRERRDCLISILCREMALFAVHAYSQHLCQPTGWTSYHFYCIEPWRCYIWGFWIAECENMKSVTLTFHAHFWLLHTIWIVELYAYFLSSFCWAVKKHLPSVTVPSLLWLYVMSLTHILGSYTNILMLPASGVHLSFEEMFAESHMKHLRAL
jgi:hypothetical protein